MNLLRLKYQDLSNDLQDFVQHSYGHIPKSKNPTLNHIIKELKRRSEKNKSAGATITADEQLTTAEQLHKYIQDYESNKIKTWPKGWYLTIKRSRSFF